MKSKTPIPNFDPREVAFNVEALRGYFHSAALEALTGLQEQGVAHGETACITAAVEFAVQIWAQVSIRCGVPPKKARETLEREIRTFWRKHLDAELGQAPARLDS
jgi:hypothetical protein